MYTKFAEYKFPPNCCSFEKTTDTNRNHLYRILTDFAYTGSGSKTKKATLKKLFMIERLIGASTLQFQLVQESELLSIVQSGEKLSNAYIYAVADESADLDSELFNLDRVRQQSYDLFTPTIKFEHCHEVTHQNYLTRKSCIAKPVQPKQAPVIPLPVKKEPLIKSEIKKNEIVKPTPAGKKP